MSTEEARTDDPVRPTLLDIVGKARLYLRHSTWCEVAVMADLDSPRCTCGLSDVWRDLRSFTGGSMSSSGEGQG